MSYQASGQARGRIFYSGFSKKLAGFFIRNLIKLVDLASSITYMYYALQK
jgi:hypothetical protein